MTFVVVTYKYQLSLGARRKNKLDYGHKVSVNFFFDFFLNSIQHNMSCKAGQVNETVQLSKVIG